MDDWHSRPQNSAGALKHLECFTMGFSIVLELRTLTFEVRSAHARAAKRAKRGFCLTQMAVTEEGGVSVVVGFAARSHSGMVEDKAPPQHSKESTDRCRWVRVRAMGRGGIHPVIVYCWCSEGLIPGRGTGCCAIPWHTTDTWFLVCGC